MGLFDKKNYILLILIVSLTGCELVKSTQKVVYEDQIPVVETKVHQWNDTVDYIMYTNVLGEWSLTLPVASRWELCIENPKNNYEESCYDGTLVVDIDGELIKE